MEGILQKFIKRHLIKHLLGIIIFLCGFGVYLGRFLRYNSWEIINKPLSLFNDIIHIVIFPNLYTEAWLFTILFGVFLSIGNWMFKQIYSIPTNQKIKNPLIKNKEA